VVCALLGRARGKAVTSVEASLAMTATLYQAGDVATLAVHGALGDLVGDEARGPSIGRRLYRAKDGWVTVYCVTEAQLVELGAAVGAAAPTAPAVADAMEVLTTAEVLARLQEAGVPAAPSLHHSAVPDDPQVVARDLLCHYEHPAAGRFVQVGIPLSLSVDAPAVRGPAPTPAPVRRMRR
jgi:crotonobetainyl-CoA:carnitine CoA-transferase CaiB-like acyl-CoA transferase